MKPRQCDFKAFVGQGSANERQAIVRATCGSPYTAFWLTIYVKPVQNVRNLPSYAQFGPVLHSLTFFGTYIHSSTYFSTLQHKHFFC